MAGGQTGDQGGRCPVEGLFAGEGPGPVRSQRQAFRRQQPVPFSRMEKLPGKIFKTSKTRLPRFFKGSDPGGIQPSSKNRKCHAGRVAGPFDGNYMRHRHPGIGGKIHNGGGDPFQAGGGLSERQNPDNPDPRKALPQTKKNTPERKKSSAAKSFDPKTERTYHDIKSGKP